MARVDSNEAAFRWAMKRLNRRALSVAEMRAKLAEHPVDDAVIEPVINRLQRIGALDDEALGQALVDELQRTKSAGPQLIRTKLLKRGLAEALVERLVSGSHDAVSLATSLAQKKLATMRALNAVTQQQRLWSLLARRGFDEDVIEQALSRLNIDVNG